ncbi:OB-fold domain-containing protein [Acrocarpospora sp. B8E8]|uniref:Zn-ribbon domain-containing OB-fold protein n=1 Tax=Acrocarpospora sp. B8E8 TaxID=3153572 RepID=UPI00325F4E82
MIDVVDAIGSGLPVPEVDAVSRPFFEALDRGEFVLQRFPDGRWQHYPRPPELYPVDGRPDFQAASGHGEVHTFTIIRQSGVPYHKARLPYVVAIIETAEGVRLMGNVTDVPVDDVTIGMPVQVYGVRVAEGLALPFWRRRG